ncbi:hypothetical protein ACH5RR_031701 [Cinchona calisaya]|uniref:Uncharacterized protein n=1 Tax=Cinchona calisaya TaxID=153742 RepID=A0ABD2YK17_9GENT
METAVYVKETEHFISNEIIVTLYGSNGLGCDSKLTNWLLFSFGGYKVKSHAQCQEIGAAKEENSCS